MTDPPGRGYRYYTGKNTIAPFGMYILLSFHRASTALKTVPFIAVCRSRWLRRCGLLRIRLRALLHDLLPRVRRPAGRHRLAQLG